MFTDFFLSLSQLYPSDKCEVEKLVVIQGIVASVKYPRDKALVAYFCVVALRQVALVVGAQGRPQVYQL